MSTNFFHEQLRHMPPSMCLVAFYLSQGYSDAMIAGAINTTVDAVKTIVYRLRNHLGFDGVRVSLILAIRDSLD